MNIEQPNHAFSQAYRRYVLASLTVVYTLNALDQGLISLLVQPIKDDLGLSDTEVGFMTGIAFGLFYATLGVPIARWSDRGNRVTITSLAIGAWGATLMLCLFVSNFMQLVAARVAAAVGESGCMPATYSLVGDYFPKSAERTRAMSVYMLASPVSVLVSFMAGGWLNEHIGWRATFFVMGIPGLVAAVLIKLTVREPRTTDNQSQGSRPPATPMKTVIRTLWQQRSFRHLSAALILLYTMGLGLGPWYAAFMIRSHGMGTAELGVWLGLIFGIAGVVGVALGGYVSSRWFAANEAGQMRTTALLVAATVPCFLLFSLLTDRYQALIALVPLVVVCNFFFGPTFALMQRLVSADLRATTMALVMLLANLIGMGIGPQLVGALSDLLNPMLGSASLGYAMMTMSLVALWSAYHFWKVARTVDEDLAAANPCDGSDAFRTALNGAETVVVPD